MRIRLVPLLISSIAAAIAVGAAVAIGALILPGFMRLSLGANGAKIALWVAIGGGVATALWLCLLGRDSGDEHPRGGSGRNSH